VSDAGRSAGSADSRRLLEIAARLSQKREDTMTAYQNCKVDEAVQRMTGSDDDGYGFHIRSGNNRPLVTLMFATEKDAEEARAEVAMAVARATEITPHGA